MNLVSESQIPWSMTTNAEGIEPKTIFFGPNPKGFGSFEVAVASGLVMPKVTTMRDLHRARLDGRDSSLVLAVQHGVQVTLIGPESNSEPRTLPAESAHRQLQAALYEPDSIQATKRYLSLSAGLNQTRMTGVRNKGLFATYHLRENSPKRANWKELSSKASSIIHSRGRELIQDLGFIVSETTNHSLVLNDQTDSKRAVALLLDESEHFDSNSSRFHSSPVAWGLSNAQELGVPWLLVLRREQIRLYPAKDGVGVGQKGQTETFLELDLAALSDEYMGLLSLIFSAEALSETGSASELLEESNRYSSALGTRLRERIYEEVVPDLAKAVAVQIREQGEELDSERLQTAYRTTLRILFRLLFQAYAEDRGLLPAGRNAQYDEHSLTKLASDFIEGETDFSEGNEIWSKLQKVWEAIDQGNKEWGVPPYNGGLFGSDPELRPYGSRIKRLSFPDSLIGPTLKSLLVDKTEDGVAGVVDFRSLSVREFGTIYEGLLESSLSVAELDLTLDADATWVPANEGQEVLAPSGEPYYHNTSGERKATGSYFTPDFVVDHLIERAIEPSISAHLEKVKSLIDEEKLNAAAKLFFDFRVADLAMGSAHFLVAAVDKIESKMRSFLAQPGNEIPGVSNELQRLAEAARKALGKDLVAIDDIDDAVLLRRQIARRCVYGVDINPLAVELSRLAIWIHTFVPGLPMSTLDHNLVCANSLTGIGSIEEAEAALELRGSQTQLATFDSFIRDSLSAAHGLLSQWSDASEATKAEVSEAYAIAKEAEEKSQPVKGMLDVALAVIAGVVDKKAIIDPEGLVEIAQSDKVRDFIEDVQPAHMPFLFPEVFVRDNPGFDALVGNPPWETLVPDERKFWAMKFPGLMGHGVEKRKELIKKYRTERPDVVAEMDVISKSMESQRKILKRKFDLGDGHVDLSEAFAWSFFALIRKHGRAGLVLPKTAFSSKGLQTWRRHVLSEGSVESLVTATNTGRWAFNIEGRYSIAFAVLAKGVATKTRISGPFFNKRDFLSGRDEGAQWESDVVLKLTESSAFPNLGNQTSADILTKMRESPSLKDWENAGVTPVQELNATSDRPHFDHLNPEKPVIVLSGRGFNIWTPFTGEVFATAEYEKVKKTLVDRLLRQSKLSSSAFHGFSWPDDFGSRLPFESPRIALRLMTNPTNSRTVIPALVSGGNILPNTAPFLFFREKDSSKEAFLLGILSSLCLDWYARKFVESALNNHFLNAFPIPSMGHSASVESRIIYLSGILAAVDENYAEWASKVGVPVGTLLDEDQRNAAIYELDALVAIAYGLDEAQVRHIFETFQRGWDFEPRLEKVLEFFETWGGEK